MVAFGAETFSPVRAAGVTGKLGSQLVLLADHSYHALITALEVRRRAAPYENSIRDPHRVGVEPPTLGSLRGQPVSASPQPPRPQPLPPDGAR